MFWDEAVSSSGPLTIEDFQAAIRAIREYREPDPCTLGKHVVSPPALYRAGTYLCVNCMCPIEIPYPLSERA